MGRQVPPLCAELASCRRLWRPWAAEHQSTNISLPLSRQVLGLVFQAWYSHVATVALGVGAAFVWLGGPVSSAAWFVIG